MFGYTYMLYSESISFLMIFYITWYIVLKYCKGMLIDSKFHLTLLCIHLMVTHFYTDRLKYEVPTYIIIILMYLPTQQQFKYINLVM